MNILKKRTVYLSSFWGPLYFTIEGTKPLAPRGKRMTESQREKGFRFFWGISTCYWSLLWSLFQFAIFKPLEGGHARLTPRLLCSPMCFSQFENLGIVFEDDHHEKKKTTWLLKPNCVLICLHFILQLFCDKTSFISLNCNFPVFNMLIAVLAPINFLECCSPKMVKWFVWFANSLYLKVFLTWPIWNVEKTKRRKQVWDIGWSWKKINFCQLCKKQGLLSNWPKLEITSSPCQPQVVSEDFAAKQFYKYEFPCHWGGTGLGNVHYLV